MPPRCSPTGQDELYPQGIIEPAQCMRDCLQALGYRFAAPPSSAVRPSGNNRAFVLMEPMVYEVGSTKIKIIVPAGFVTDYASIPKRLWSLYSPHDQYSRAAVVHDYLYWSQLCTKKQADNLLMIAMKESEVPEATRNKVYAAVRTFGGASWNSNRQQREKKLPRVVPIQLKDFPPNWTWEMYREKLVAEHVADPVFTGNEYCGLGNTTEVPTNMPGMAKASSQNLSVKMVERPGWY